MVGAALGVLIAWKGLALIVAWVPTNSFAAESVIEMNLPVLLFSTALAVVTAIVFGVWPALQLSRPDLGRVAQASTRRVIGSAQGRRVHRVMVAVQVALTLLMLTAAGAAGKGFLRLANADLGYDPQNTMSLPIPVHDGTYQTWKERSEYFERLRAAVAAMPQVVSAGISTNATPPSNGGDTAIEILGSGALEKPIARSNFVSPEYFSLLQIPLAQGRLWTRDEIMRGAPLAVINQTMARQYWPNGDAIGRQFRFANMKDEPPYSPAAVGADGWMEIVGIVADARNDGLRNPIKPAFYVPYTLKMRMFTQILVRSRVPPLSILRDVRAELVRVDREQQVMRVRDLRRLDHESARVRATSVWSRGCSASSRCWRWRCRRSGSTASCPTASRPGRTSSASAWRSGRGRATSCAWCCRGRRGTLVSGSPPGVLLCLIFDSVASQWVTESSRDPLILGGVTVLLLAVAVMACLAPARRAASIDPMDAVRHE